MWIGLNFVEAFMSQIMNPRFREGGIFFFEQYFLKKDPLIFVQANYNLRTRSYNICYVNSCK